MRRVLVTGSRNLNQSHRPNIFGDLRAQANIAGGLDKLIVVHGDCPTGADALAHEFCEFFPDVTEERYPAEWKIYGKAAGPVRNSVMLATKPDVVLAYPRGESPGTTDCFTKARAANIPVIFG